MRLELHKDQTSEERETHARKSTYKKVLHEVPFLILFYLWVAGKRLSGNQQAYALRITRDKECDYQRSFQPSNVLNIARATLIFRSIFTITRAVAT